MEDCTVLLSIAAVAIVAVYVAIVAVYVGYMLLFASTTQTVRGMNVKGSLRITGDSIVVGPASIDGCAAEITTNGRTILRWRKGATEPEVYDTGRIRLDRTKRGVCQIKWGSGSVAEILLNAHGKAV